MILHGKDLIVSIDGNANMASKSCTLNVSAKSIVKTSPTSGDWEEVLSGKKSWSLTTNHLVKEATAEAPVNIFSHAEIEVTNSMADGWHVVGNGDNGNIYNIDERSISDGIHLMEMTGYGQLIRITVFDKDGKYGSTQDALLNYLNGGSMGTGADAHTIGNDTVIILMTVGEFRMNSDICSLLSTTYHAAMPCMELGKSPAYGNPTYETTPLIVVGGKSLTYGYVGINSISNEILFNLINDDVPVQADGIPGHIEMVGKKVTVRMKDEHGSEWVGQAEVTQFKVTGTKGNLMAGSFSFKGNGELQTDSLLDFTPQKPTSYVNRIIIDMNQSNPAKMITGDIGGDIFESIMSYAHRYLCKYMGDGEMAMCQLDDANSMLFAGGGTATLDGSQGDVYVGFGRRFFYHVIYAGNNRYIFEVANSYMSGSWQTWEPEYLIAAFRAQPTTGYNNAVAGVAGGNYYLRSIANGQPVFADTFANLDLAMERMIPDFFSKIGPEEHAIIALLYYMKNGNPNSQAICGVGGSGQATGASAMMGMQDTDATTGDAFVNLFGLEDWWRGGEGEYMGRIRYNGGKIYVTPWGGSEAAGVDISTPLANEETVIRNMLFSSNPLMMIPAGSQSPQSKNWGTYFCDGVRIPGHSQIVTRGKGDDALSGGIAAMKLGRNTTPTDTDATRLCFRGESVIVYDDHYIFENLTAVDPAN